MRIDEFTPILRYLKAVCGVAEVTTEQAAGYFDLLGDLDAAIVLAAAKAVALEHVYPSLPPVGLIRKAALALTIPSIPAPEAWQLFLAAVRKFGSGRRRFMRGGQWHESDREADGMATLPPSVAHAARCFGWQRLCDTMPDHLALAERDFIASYGTLAKRDESKAIMPPAVRAIAERMFDAEPKQLPARVTP